MNKTVTIVLAVVLMVIVMTISVILFFTGSAAREKWEFQEIWTASFSGAESLVWNLPNASHNDGRFQR